MVSTTPWQSTPAVKPGPRASTTGASVMAVPRLRLARMASTTPSKGSSLKMAASGSQSTGTSPRSSARRAAPASSARRAAIPSTWAAPSYMHWEKATVRRTAVGRATSVMTTFMPARYSRTAVPVARSPAPLIKTSIIRPAPPPDSR